MPTFEKLPARIEAWEFLDEPERVQFLIDWADNYGTDIEYVMQGEDHPGRRPDEYMIEHSVSGGLAYGHKRVPKFDAPAFLAIRTLEGVMRSDPGHFVIRGVENEFYSCERAIFFKTYRQVDEALNDESL